MATQSIDEARLEEFVGQLVTELGASLNAALVMIGDRLGLYRAMDGAGALTPGELAARTDTHERYVREWLNAQAAGGFVAYDPDTERYTLPPEQAFVLAQEDSPAAFAGAFQLVSATVHDADRIADDFQSGGGVGWHEHHHGLFEGTERFFRPGYNANLVSSWIPALAGVEAKLLAGARVADIGCGHGASTILMAQAYPASTFVGYDYHEGSIEAARSRAQAAGVSDRVRFEVAAADAYTGTGFDLVACFDCLHDMGDPTAAGRHVLSSLAPDGTWLIVEPLAGDSVEDNLNPIGRLYYSASTLLCTPASLSQDGRAALGAQAGEKRIGEVVRAAGFGHFERVCETPTNLVFEARR